MSRGEFWFTFVSWSCEGSAVTLSRRRKCRQTYARTVGSREALHRGGADRQVGGDGDGDDDGWSEVEVVGEREQE